MPDEIKESVIVTLRQWGVSINEDERIGLLGNPMMQVACNAILEDMVWDRNPTLWQKIKRLWGNKMPWPHGSDFASKHNHKLHGRAAQKAADVATAMVNKGVPEGEAIATANKVGNNASKKHPKNRPYNFYKKE